jgi:hypothetical protein
MTGAWPSHGPEGDRAPAAVPRYLAIWNRISPKISNRISAAGRLSGEPGHIRGQDRIAVRTVAIRLSCVAPSLACIDMPW